MEIESIIKNFFTKIDVFTGEFYQTLNKDITSILAHSSNKKILKKYFPTCFMKPA